MVNGAIDEFRAAIERAGLPPPDTIEADGKIHRWPTNGRRDDDSGWYIVHVDGIPAGRFGDWRTGVDETWRLKLDRKLSPVEASEFARRVEEAKREKAAEENRRRGEARLKATEMWQAATPASADHPYLIAKGVQPHGIRQDGDRLVVPMRDAGELHSLQFISPGGKKTFLSGGRAKGCYFSIKGHGETACVAEGYATAASIHEATGYSVAVAFNAGNLEPVARALRERLPKARLVICADDDRHTDGNPGMTKAMEAARAAGALVAVPAFAEDEAGSDFNDMRSHDAIAAAVAAARAPDVPTHPDGDASASEALDEAPARRFEPVTMLELVNKQLPEREALLAPWLYAQGLAQVHAWRGTGKTHFSLGVAYAVATGGSFLRWEAPAPAPVLFIDGEMPAVALQERLKAILAADGRDIDVDGSMLRILTPDLLAGAPPDLANPEDQEHLQRVIDEFGPRLIVVDNISTLVRSGGGENDAEAWIPVQGWALRMRREGRSVLFVHHTGKGGKQRGTSKREDVLDVVMALRRPDPYDPADGARFIVEFEKARYLHGDDTKSFETQLTQDARGRQAWTIRDLEESTMERVVRLVGDGLKMREIAEELGVAKSTVSRAMKRAQELGLISGKEGL